VPACCFGIPGPRLIAIIVTATASAITSVTAKLAAVSFRTRIPTTPVAESTGRPIYPQKATLC
jgi:hypothetical protein